MRLKNVSPLLRTEISSRVSRAQAGIGKLTLLVFGGLLAALLYSAYQILPFYYGYFEMHNQMLSIIPKADTLKDVEIRRRLLRFIKELDIPADERQLILDRRDHRLRLRLSYEEEFYIPWGERDIVIQEFPFSIDVEGPY